ncbi:Carcinoembryonic antigen-related cell adhesion molecule 5 [Cricetulus griseus]|uniref:Carcinoembryonic antigen-related cell adhesion molecule 5 n=1 Tax=Cricetulus griseus TaxID=10029 RepID=G3IFX8_CRIGR|nr:Carcinoembryonic antigen-related cell adhesion molecule 5 [Cricetulus griseus]
MGFLKSLLASLLTFYHLSTTAHVIIESVPPLVAKGDDVLFLVRDLPENIQTLAWFKGLTNTTDKIAEYGLFNNVTEPGSVHSGRETIYLNGSLLIEKLTEKDIGFYTLRTYDEHAKIVSTTPTYLHVQDFLWNCGRHATSAQPTIESVPPSVAEGGNVTLIIHNLPENLEVFVWFKGTSVLWEHEIARYIVGSKSSITSPANTGRETLNSDGSLVLHNVTQNDTGLYTLRIQSTDLKSEEAHVQLQVHTSHSANSSQLRIQLLPQYAAEGESVLLRVHKLPEDFQAFTWYRTVYDDPYFEIVKHNRVLNTTTWGAQYSRRETVYDNGTLQIKNITQKDAGMYTLAILKSDSKIEKVYVQFHVNKHVEQPFVRVTNEVVSSNRSAIFTCVSPDTDVSIRWFFNKQPLQLSRSMTLSPAKCGLRIHPVGLENVGEYQCEVSNRVSLATSAPLWFE